MSEYNKDGLEDFIKSKLNEQSGRPGWNEPGDDLFDQAVEKIDTGIPSEVSIKNNEQKIKRRYLPLIFLSLGVLLLTSFYLWNKNSQSAYILEEQKNEILNQEKEIAKLKAQNSLMSEKQEEIVAESEVKTEVHVFEEDDERTNLVDAVTNFVANDVNQSKLANAGSFNSSSNQVITKVETPTSNNQVVYQQSIPRSKVIRKQSVSKVMSDSKVDLNSSSQMSIPMLASISPALFEIENDLSIKEISTAFILNEAAENAIQLSGNISYVQSAIDMDKSGMNNFILEGYDEFSNGFALGLKVDKSISDRFSVFSDLSLNKLNNQSVYKSHVNYDLSNVYTSPSGEAVYHNTMEVMSPMGRIAMDDMISMDDEIAMDDQDEMDNETSISQDFYLSSLSIGLGANLLQTNRFSIRAELAPNINYLFGYDSSLNTTLSFENKLVSAYGSDSVKDPNLNAVSFSLRGSLVLDYELSKNWSLFFTGSYQQTLSSLKQTSTADPLASYLKLRSISTGLSYRF